MNLTALAFGLLVAALLALRFRRRGQEYSRWSYPLLLASFPAWYWAFALRAADPGALAAEVLAGVAFIAIALVAASRRSVATLLLLAFGYVAHAVYDVMHDTLVSNPGVPVWWPEFCGAVDLVLGVYIVLLAMRLRRREPSSTAGTSAG